MSEQDSKRNLFLAGMMGAGKSAVGKLAAEMLGYRFVDTDAMIESDQSMTVAEIFKSQGEKFFRSAEKVLLRRVCQSQQQVVATGGGMFLDEANLMLARGSGLVVYLYAPVEVLASRLRSAGDRPLLEEGNPRQRLAEIYNRRRRLYDRITTKVDTTAGTERQVALTLVSVYRSWLGR